MDSLADLWILSGKKNELLYRGSTEDIIKELKAWVERRETHNDVQMSLSWNMFRGMDSMQQLSTQSSNIQEGQIPVMMDQVRAIVATQVDHLDRNRNLENTKDGETRLADFFLRSLGHRGFSWPRMPCTERTPTDAGVCAFLGTVDQSFDAKKELEILEDSVRVTQWQAELQRRDAIRAQEIANDPIPGMDTHPIGSIGARFRQVIANDPSRSTVEALNDAADSVMIPGSLDSVLGRNSTGSARTTGTTGEATRSTGQTNRTTDGTAVPNAGTSGSIDVTTGEEDTTTNNTVVYIADTLGNVTIATASSSNIRPDRTKILDNTAAPSSSNAATTPKITHVAPGTSSNASDDMNVAAGPSSSTAQDGAKDQTMPGTEGQDGDSKMSKAKKTREGRKRAKAAQAKEAAGSSGEVVGNDDDDDGGDVAEVTDV